MPTNYDERATGNYKLAHDRNTKIKRGSSQNGKGNGIQIRVTQVRYISLKSLAFYREMG